MSKYKLVKKETKEKTINFKDDSVKSIMLKRRKEEEIAKKFWEMVDASERKKH